MFLGKGNYWTIHPNCMVDFRNGDFRRRQARRRARRNIKTVSINPVNTQIAPPNAYVTMTPAAVYEPYTVLPRRRLPVTQLPRQQPSPMFSSHQVGYPLTVFNRQMPYYSPMTGYPGLQEYGQSEISACRTSQLTAPTNDVTYISDWTRQPRGAENSLQKREHVQQSDNTVII